MKTSHLFCCCLIVTIRTFGQDSTASHTLSANFGIGSVYNKDHFQSPYTFKGLNATIGIGYSYRSSRHQHEVDLMVTSGRLSSDVSPKAVSQLGTLTYNYLVKPEFFTGKIYGTFGFGLHAIATTVKYLPEVPQSKAYASGGAFLSLTGRIAYALSKRSDITLTLGVSAVGIVHRPTFEVHGKSITAVVLPGDGFLFDARLQYHYKLKYNIDLTVAYQNNYFSIGKANPMYLSQNLLTIGIRKRIGRK